LAVVPSGIAVSATPGTPTLAMITYGFSAAPSGIAVSATAGAPSLAMVPTGDGSGWETIYGAIGEARGQHLKHAERRKRPVDCPVHLWPLEVVGNVYHCKFGGHTVRLPAPSP
jgi:hypothetical protein